MSRTGDDNARRPALRPGQRARLAVQRAPAPRVRTPVNQRGAPASKPAPSLWVRWLFWLALGAIALLFAAGLLYSQGEIAWVLLSNRPAQARIEALSCTGGRAQTGHVTLRFTDDRGVIQTVFHAKDTFGCFAAYHVGETVAIRYSTSNPGALLTQAELDELPVALPLWALLDVLCLIIPFAVIRFVRPYSTMRRTRYGQPVND